MARKVQAILKLKDEYSSPVKKATAETRKLKDQQKKAAAQCNKWINDLNNKAVNGLKKATKYVVGFGAAISGLALKTGFSEAFDLETYKTQLETATKDTKRAADVMKYAVDLANRTPFEAGELVSAASQLEMFGLSTERWLPLLGDAAAATNKSMDDIKSGFIKAATTGDFQSLRDTLAITKEMVDEYSKTNFGKSFMNSKGQITDTDVLQDSLEGLIQSRYAGGMEALSKTTKGVWSTITGVTKNSLARIVGMQNDGTVKSGSMLDKLKGKVSQLADTLVKWQEDGTIDKIADKVSVAFTKAFNAGAAAIEFLRNNMVWIKPVAIGLVSVFTAFNVVISAKKKFDQITSVIKILKTAFVGLKSGGMLAMAPFVKWIAIGALVVGAVVLIIKNWDKIKEAAKNLWKKLKEIFGTIKDILVYPFKLAWEKIKGFWEKIKGIFNKIDKKTEKYSFSGLELTGYNLPNYKKNALGTSYYSGGLTRINEHGGEIVNLPNGTQIIPHDVSSKMATNNSSVTVNVTIQGNVLGNEEYANKLGAIIAKKIRMAQLNY